MIIIISKQPSYIKKNLVHTCPASALDWKSPFLYMLKYTIYRLSRFPILIVTRFFNNSKKRENI